MKKYSRNKHLTEAIKLNFISNSTTNQTGFCFCGKYVEMKEKRSVNIKSNHKIRIKIEPNVPNNLNRF